ncbi:MAG TPA: hypothetical protein QGF05_10750 [Dehalococcoidia bacterium]|nr:hypothetical protein [Dehalococcoidia bacterium]
MTVIAFGLLALHLGALLADRVVGFSLLNVVGVDAATFRPAAVFAGSLAAWMMVGATLAFARRQSLGTATWRVAHRIAYAAWVLALVHGVAAGSDSGSAVVQWLYLLTAVPLTGAVVYRLARSTTAPASEKKKVPPRSAPPPVPTVASTAPSHVVPLKRTA